MKIKLYTPENKNIWDDFVRNSRNGTFLFYRDFIEYHGKRFEDYSLMFYSGDNLIALLPGHIEDKVYYSHRGLTYGGLIMGEKATAANVLTIFRYLTTTFRHQGIQKIVYKAVPHIYHKFPAEEDLYALFRHKAVVSTRNISSTILLPDKTAYSEQRRRGLKKAQKNGLVINKSCDFFCFWEILSSNLKEKYNTKPVHTLKEINYLKEKFPDNIHLFTVTDADNNCLSGCVVFETDKVIHVQYVAATEEGKNLGAVDLVIDHIINSASGDKLYFDYGTSTENNGWHLNESLIHQKEGFGARATVYDIYTIDLSI
ncbi:GNAT family N-acetyltransferase [Prevotella sp. 10(H)]|uniref:GNAT family N-acetyltransferase n=1 Tax=Prevotella sp. 10(H) TaxID=1158294 RepID=UPI0004A76479|nr:GNAT family N-acetyltransferase [Prevotella sp. 10(H)]